MPFTITASVRDDYPGAVLLSVTGDPGVPSGIVRIDGTAAAQPVRNYSTTGSGVDQVTDMEAPLGRPIRYNLVDYSGLLLAQTGAVTCPPLPSGRGILRSVLKPKVAWMEVEAQDETGIEWGSSTTVHRVVGKDTPVIIGEIRQRHSGVMSFLCRSIAEADKMVLLLRDGTPMLLRHDPCAQPQTRDLLFYALDVRETRWGRLGWRLVLVDYQSTAFVPGETEEPVSDWTFQALRDSAATFTELTSHYRTFADMALDIRKTGGGAPAPATGLQVTSRTQTTITLGWTNPPGALGVPIVRRAAGSVPPATSTAGVAVAVTGAGATTATDTGLTLDTAYAYSVWTTDPTGVELAATPSTLATRSTGYGVPTGTTLTTLTTSNNPYPTVATFPTAHTYQIAGDATFVNWRFERRVNVIAGDVEFVNCYFAGSPTETSIANVALLMSNVATGTAHVTATNCTFGMAVPLQGVDGLRGDRLTIDSCNIFGTVDGMQLYGVGQTIIKDTWIHGLIEYPTGGPGGGPTHNDCAQISSGVNFTFLRNKCEGTINSLGILISQNLGTTSDLLIEGNTFNLTGNGADVGVKDYDHPVSPRAVTGLVIRNNFFKKDLAKYQIHPSTLTFDHSSFVYNPNAWMDGSAPPSRGWAVEDVWP